MIYLDNAATSFPKPNSVKKAVSDCLNKYCGNPGRGTNYMALKASEAIYNTREAIAEFLNYNNPENIIFTLNSTYALNIAIKTTFLNNCRIITSDIEHNAVLRPLYKLKKDKKIDLDFFSTDGDIEKNIVNLITDKTRGIVCNLLSNVSGKEIPLSILSKIKQKYSLKLIVDASQLMGHKLIDLTKNPCDVLCGTGHKALFGIQGCGFAVFCDNMKRESFIQGGSGINSKNEEMPDFFPEQMEAGTLPTPSIVALNKGIDFIKSKSIKYIDDNIQELTKLYLERLKEIKGIRVIGENGIISFDFENIPSSAISELLNGEKICVRSGFHCAPLIHKKLKSDQFGLTRVSLSVMNNKSQADKLYYALKRIRSNY